MITADVEIDTTIYVRSASSPPTNQPHAHSTMLIVLHIFSERRRNRWKESHRAVSGILSDWPLLSAAV